MSQPPDIIHHLPSTIRRTVWANVGSAIAEAVLWEFEQDVCRQIRDNITRQLGGTWLWSLGFPSEQLDV